MVIIYNTAHGQEPDDHGHDLLKPHGIFPYFTVNGYLPQKFEADVEIKDCTDADRPEEPHEESLSSLLDLFDVQMHCKYFGYSSEQ